MGIKYVLIFRHDESSEVWIEGKFDNQEDAIDYIHSNDISPQIDYTTIVLEDGDELYVNHNAQSQFERMVDMKTYIQRLASLIQNPLEVKRSEMLHWLNDVESFQNQFKQLVGEITSTFLKGKVK